MAEMRIVVLVLMLLFFVEKGRGDYVAEEEKLRSALLTNYSTKVRPQNKTGIYVSIILSSLNHLNIASQSMSVNLLLLALWTDQRLVWNSSDYQGLQTLVTAPEDIWTPPLVIENSVSNVGVLGGKDRDATPVRFTSQGVVQWTPPTEVTVSCEMLIAKYPYDTQTCSIIIIGWTYPLSEMDMAFGDVDIETLFSPNGEFDLMNTSTSTKNIGGPDESGTYKKVVFKLTFRRKWQFYGQNLLMPIVLNSVMMNAVFLLPIESGEKMGFCLTVLLSYTVFLTWVTENLPPVSTDTSILQVYLAVVLCLGCLATLLTTWILHLYHQPLDKPLSGFYVIMARRVLLPLGNCSCFRKRPPYKHGADTQDPLTSTGNRIFPADPGAGNGKLIHRKPSEFGGMKITEVDGLPATRKDREELDRHATTPGAAGRGGAWETTQHDALTWQEFAVLLDWFLFWVFAVLLVTLTSVIFALLYADY